MLIEVYHIWFSNYSNVVCEVRSINIWIVLYSRLGSLNICKYSSHFSLLRRINYAWTTYAASWLAK